MVKALVTGATGFLGSHIVHTLLGAGHTVRVLRRSRSQQGLLEGLPVEHAIGDVINPESLDAAMAGCEWVFHAAAISDYWRSNRIKLYLVNVNGTINVLEAARRAGVRRVIQTSSGAAIGMRYDGAPADETIPFNMSPSAFPYGHSKYLADLEALRAVERGQDVVILNPSVVLGPGDINMISGSMVVEVARGNVLIYPAGGSTVIDVRDVAAAHLAAAERGRSGERYLLGAQNLTFRESLTMAAQVAHVTEPFIPVPSVVSPFIAFALGLVQRTGIALPIDADQIRLSAKNIYFDCHKAWVELGAPKIGIRQSVEETYQWYVEHGFIKRRSP